MENNGSKEIIAFYNVENLLMPDPPPVHKTDPSASGLRNWDERKYRIKLSKIAHVFQLIADQEGVTPLLIGLCEVQGREPLEELLALTPFPNHQIVHYGSSDLRGIDVALLYDRTKLQLISSQPLSFNFQTTDGESQPDPTRDILHCRFHCDGRNLNVFVLHLPSKREKDVNKALRTNILEQLHQVVTEYIANGEAVIICGDFNANPDEDTVKKLLYDKDFMKVLHNPFGELLSANKFSTYHRANGLLFDQIILSDGFYRTGFPLKFKTAKIFSYEKLRVRDRKLAARPAKTFAGTRYLGGYSDHFPVITEFEKR
ncbi:hypothetical protein FIC_01839 [Flavobacteriaceae bacterium 3519-10]|nr:hypothetical protein FIC_01839 [Flavobacteriaceae bacterium 3519-10]